MSDPEIQMIPKKFYRYFLKGLSYYTFRLNRACTLGELQAYVLLKGAEKLTDIELILLSEQVMEQLVETQIAHLNGGCYRLNELLRPFEHVEPSEMDTTDSSQSSKASKRSGKTVKFSSLITLWTIDSEGSSQQSMKVDYSDASIGSAADRATNNQKNDNFPNNSSPNPPFRIATDTSSDDEQ